MDAETKKVLQGMQESFDSLAASVANGFSRMEESNAEVARRLGLLEEEVRSLRQETKSIRTELERIPDDIDKTYSGTFNDLLERVSTIEKHLGISAKA